MFLSNFDQIEKLQEVIDNIKDVPSVIIFNEKVPQPHVYKFDQYICMRYKLIEKKELDCYLKTTQKELPKNISTYDIIKEHRKSKGLIELPNFSNRQYSYGTETLFFSIVEVYNKFGIPLIVTRKEPPMTLKGENIFCFLGWHGYSYLEESARLTPSDGYKPRRYQQAVAICNFCGCRKLVYRINGGIWRKCSLKMAKKIQKMQREF